MIKMSKYIGK